MSEGDRFRVITGGNRPLDGSLGGQVRRLFANLARIAAGAGKPEEVEAQVLELAVAIEEAQQRSGVALTDERLREWLDADDGEHFRALGGERDQERWRRDGTAERVYAINTIVRGALRLAASRVTANTTQEQLAESLLLNGVRTLDELQARLRAEAQTARRTHRQSLSPRGTELSQPMLDALAWVAYRAETGEEASPRPRPSTLASLLKRRLLTTSSAGFGLTKRGGRIAAKLPRPTPVQW